MSQIVARGVELGILKEGWRFIDYCIDAIPAQKWICAIIWGEKGNDKSELLLQHGYMVYHGFDTFERLVDGTLRGQVTNWEDDSAWELVFGNLVLRPNKYADIIAYCVENGVRVPWLGWDDINIHLPRSMYSTNRIVWETISKNWEGSRTLISVFECSAPRKDKVVSFILGDMNWDILNSGRKIADVRRWMWDRDFYEPERVNKASLKIEEYQIEEKVPEKQWNRYWKLRTETNAELTKDLVRTMREIDTPSLEKQKTPMACPWCGKPMNEWNLKTHEPVCKQKPKQY